MNVEFHYYVIHYLARKAGIPEEEARIMAYSSQFVDDNVVGYSIDTGREVYETVVTQNYGWWDDSFPRTVYVPFHFFPCGEDKSESIRRDGKRNRLNCAANSRPVKDLLIAALKTRDPYRVGIALHTFADSWAHQNFSGRLEDWNALAEDSPVPSIGHAQALTSPDDVTATWSDTRLRPPYSRVDNRQRFREAATKIYKYLCVYSGRPFDDADQLVETLMEGHFPCPDHRAQEERVLDLVIQENIAQYDRRDWLREATGASPDALADELFGGYSLLLWLKDALLHRTRILRRDRVAAKTGFYRSHFYRWNEAAKAQLGAFFPICNSLGCGL